MIDIAANNGWLSSCIRIIFIMQMIIQGRWTIEPDILTIPGITKPTLSPLFRELNRNHSLRNCSVETLAGMRYAFMKNPAALEEALINVFGTNRGGEMIKSISIVPWIESNINLIETETNEKKDLIQNDFYQLFPDTEYEISLNLFRKGSHDKSVLHSARFPKKKDEGWFIILADDDELLSIKRVNIGSRSTINLKFSTPSKLGTSSFLHLIK